MILALAAAGCALGAGCRKKGETTTTAIAPSASTSTSAMAPVDASPSNDDDLHDDDDLEAEEDASAAANDATIEATDAMQDADARDAKKGDAIGDAPLLGTKTFPDETPESGFRYVTSEAAKVHKAPKDGKAFVSLQRGTQVWLVARLYDWYRIRFVDPSTEQPRQGWIFMSNVLGPPRKTCPEDWIWHDQYGGWCEKECTRNTDCKAIPGYKCSGTGCFYAQVD